MQSSAVPCASKATLTGWPFYFGPEAGSHNTIIYAERAAVYSSSAMLDQKIAPMNLVFEHIPRSAAFLAGKAYLLYRRQRGTKSNVVSDFFIGAHAAVLGCPLLTRDTRHYAAYFPGVRLIAP